ncbi:hypothetical protein SEA_PHREDRICK_267 [Streptomyces phage Phredrick]|nr:hypothetical protein SEA_FORREST_260 [Streptomyces phage Forrest]QZE11593.1 hypothetical protein SEA_JADA_261 [Streptomyces phage Jada]URQ04843.1 hypothetical protein SEA_EMMA1919_262 [Streptomyces phage Emma1919]WNN94820.1 hypothetical protein SEA_PHREDRICK_267 [Streptomyces phage Phredrick]
MRTVTVDGRSGIIAARGMGPNDGNVFVLFDGDGTAEESARWVSVESVMVTGTLPASF